MSLSGCQINPIDVNFHFQKSLEIFYKYQLPKIWSKKNRGRKVPCLMPIWVKTNKNNTVAVMGSASHLFLPAFGWLSSGLVWQAELAVGGKERCWRPPTWPPLHKVRPELSVVCKDCYSVLVESKSERGAARLRARLPSNITAVRAVPVTLVHMVVQRFCGRAFQ